MLNELSACDAVKKIKAGEISSLALTKACLERIKATDDQLKAWASIDSDHALAQAKKMDEIRKSGYPTGALHGIPVGLKDIIDTKGFPAERGTPVFAGRKPDKDACVVERLREAGAVIIGKTVTTELAFAHEAETRNPHNVDHSPGGSSSGSAAAVAAYQVPLAIGTQTNGSVVRPASFCGVFGFKPTRGVISRRGVLQTSKTLDQIGVFGRTLEDVALLVDVIGSYDPCDNMSYARPRPQMLAGAWADVPVEPDFVWFDLPHHDRLDNDAKEGFNEVLSLMGARVERMPAAEVFGDLIKVQAYIHEYEICHHLQDVFDQRWDQISPTLKPIIERGRKISDAQYEDSLQVMASAQDFFAKFFNDYDAIIAPAATGGAPLVGNGTGDPVFCTIWTLCGLPSLSMPVLANKNGLPVGLQLIGAGEQDDRLLRTTNWMLGELQS